MNIPITVKKFENVELIEPEVVSVINEYGFKTFYSLKKEAIRFLYRNLAMSYSASKILFKADKDSWKKYIAQQASRDDLEIKFNLKDKYFVLIGNMVVAISDKDLTESINNFFIPINPDKISSDEIYKVSVNIDYSNIFNRAIIELDFINGLYKIAFVLNYNGTYVLGTPREIMRSLEELVNYDIKYEYNLLMNIVETVGLAVGPDVLKDTKLSIRELLDITRICKIKLLVDSEGIVDGYQETDDPIVNKLASVFRDTRIPFKSIKHMKYLEKSMRITDVSLYDIVNLFYENYCKSKYCNVDMMNYVFYSVYYCGGDFGLLKK